MGEERPPEMSYDKCEVHNQEIDQLTGELVSWVCSTVCKVLEFVSWLSVQEEGVVKLVI